MEVEPGDTTLDLSFEAAMEVIQFCQLNDDGSFKVLLCGRCQDVMACLDCVISTLGDAFDRRLIVAVDDAGPIIRKYFGVTAIRIAEWKEDIYEEYLIERVAPHGEWPIRVAVDLSPSLRRLHRIYKIVDHNSLIILHHVDARWIKIFPALFSAIEERNSCLKSFEKVDRSLTAVTPFDNNFGSEHIFP